MNENINLYEILKGHEGETFYSPIYGDLIYYSILYPLVRFKTITGTIFDINANGKVYEDSDELFVFPSKDQRDWNKWIEKQKPKVPKTWSELVKTNQNKSYRVVINTVGTGVTDTPIEKSALALLKIHQLIEVGYGGNVSYEEWKLNTIKYIIDCNKNNFYITPCNNVIHHIAFHSKKQAEEFISYPENIQLLKDYFMINE